VIFIVAGSRTITDYGCVLEAITEARKFFNKSPTMVIQGECRGVDTLAKQFATEYKIACKGFSAQWHKHGKSAGPIRNKEMLQWAKSSNQPCALLAVWDGKSPGTLDIIRQAQKENVPIYVHMIAKSKHLF
jgi:hypothetical protein